MSSSTNLTLEERFEALMKQNEILMKTLSEKAQHDQETKAQNEYLQKQLGAYLKQTQHANKDPLEYDFKRQECVFSRHLNSSSDDEPFRVARPEPRIQASTSDFKVEIPEFEGKLDPEEFLDWLHTVKRVFEYQDILKDKKVKLVAIRLRKYASL